MGRIYKTLKIKLEVDNGQKVDIVVTNVDQDTEDGIADYSFEKAFWVIISQNANQEKFEDFQEFTEEELNEFIDSILEEISFFHSI